MKKVNLPIPYTAQGKKSANCGPCSLKMLADYFRLKNTQGECYKLHSLNRLCRVSTQWGTEFSDLNRVLRRMGLKRQKITLSTLETNLRAKRPVITAFLDEEGGGHYALIKGIERVDGEVQIIFHDSYFGANFRRTRKTFFNQAKCFNHWMWAISQ